MKKQYGDQFDTLMKQQGIKEETIKNSVRAQLAQEKAVEQSITDKDVKAKFEDYKKGN